VNEDVGTLDVPVQDLEGVQVSQALANGGGLLPDEVLRHKGLLLRVFLDFAR